MAASSEVPMAYTAGAAVLNVMHRYRDKGLTVPITPEVLIRAGVSDSLVPRTMQSLQLLQLIDEAGHPTPTLKKIKSVPQADYQTTVAEWVRSVYAEVFMFVDPETDDAIRVRDAFRSYVPHGQQTRMVALFMALCAEAGIVSATKKNEPRTAARKAATGRPAPKAAAAVLTNPRASRGAAPATAFRQPSGGVPGLHPALAGLIQGIPSAEEGWTQDERNKFYDTFGTLLDYAVPIVARRAISQEDDADE